VTVGAGTITFERANKSLLAGLPRVPIYFLHYQAETKMKFALFGAAALAATAFIAPALAQAVIEDPGYCAQFYPNANCQNLGPGNPYTDGGYYRNNWQNSNASVEHRWHHHHRMHRR